MSTTRENGGPLTVSTPTDREIIITRDVLAARGVVWDAWTLPEHLPHWLLGPPGWSMPICENDPRPGGAWRFVWRGEDGGEMAMSGVYREVEAPSRFVSTSSWGSDWPETIDTLELSEKGGTTTVLQRLLYPSKSARDAALETGMTEGMSASFDRLDEYVKTLA